MRVHIQLKILIMHSTGSPTYAFSDFIADSEGGAVHYEV